MKAVGPQRIQKCSQNSISPKKENVNKFLRFSLCNICLNNCVCLSRRNGKNAPGWCATLFWGGEMAPILALLKLVRQDCSVKQGVLRKLRVHVNCGDSENMHKNTQIQISEITW